MTRSPQAVAQTVALTDADRVDVAALLSFLRQHGVHLADTASVTRFPGGASNLTYLVDDGAHRVVVRRPPPGAHTVSGHDMLREARLMRALRPHYDKVPCVLAVCEQHDDASPLGASFYAMEQVPGRVLRSKAPRDMALDEHTMRTLTSNLVDELAALHVVPVDDALASLGKPEGYLQRQVDGWCARYDKAKTDEVSDIDAVMTWLKTHMPHTTTGPATLVHNDFKLDNVVFDDDLRIRAVLDWELATIGEPLTDVGTTLAYWIEANDVDDVRALPFGLTHLPGSLTRTEVASRWQERTQRSVNNDALVFAYVLGCFKVATIAQQIYARFARGFTSDPRFAMFGLGVAVIGAQAARAIDNDSISPR